MIDFLRVFQCQLFFFFFFYMIAYCPFSCNLSSNINILESQIFVMKPKRTDSTRPKIFQSPAAAAAAASVTAAYALAKSEKLEFIETDDSNFEGVRENNPVQDFSIEINAIREENKVLESSVAEVKAENSRVREKIDDINGTYAELSKVLSISQMTCIAHCKSSNGKKNSRFLTFFLQELHSVQGQLVVERSRCSKLEVFPFPHTFSSNLLS